MLSVVETGPGALDSGFTDGKGESTTSTSVALLGAPLSTDFAFGKKRVAGHVVFANTDLSFLDLFVFMTNAIIEERDEKK